ncbi:phage portal protein [Lysinibacillus xylanilyticus]|uniref:phage portal protein n=1 Tax=Lysinibacillus xylanilyticus TaxID=582475 RepID=UPI002B24AC7F|nr:phage portal protein [Lysinibacillus xylanilyticus]MEB2279676.1 phage portal protein [Lysinibacillus xylanilyticus]
MNEYIAYIDEKGVTPLLLDLLVKETQTERNKRLLNYNRYKAELSAVPILTRKPTDYDQGNAQVQRVDDKVNNTLNNPLDAEIVDTKVGYMFGNPISYVVDKQAQNLSKLSEAIELFNLRNSVDDLDSESGKKTAICGFSARLLYIDTDGNERAMVIDPWETIILSETADVSEPKYAFRYFKVAELDAEGEKVEIEQLVFYDSTTEKLYTRAEKDSPFVLKDERTHLFECCPLFGIPNNEELQGDADKVYKLIDAYDRTLSDASNEIEQFRLTYLVLKGMGMDDDDAEKLARTGIFELMGEHDDIKYLTKDVNDQMIENHLNRLEENIMRLAKSVNFSDESFAGNASGVAMKYKLMALENKCKTMERKFTTALRYQFKVLCSAWAKKGICSNDDYLRLWFEYKRNIPIDLLSEAQASQALKGLVSERTRLSRLSIVDDVDYELEEMEKDAKLYGNDLEPLGDFEAQDDDPISRKKKSESRARSSSKKLCEECGGSGQVTSTRTSKQILCKKCGGSGEVTR